MNIMAFYGSRESLAVLKIDGEVLNHTTPTWSMSVLQSLLRSAIRRLKQNRLVCLIDALDECDPNEIREMVYFFEDLQALAASSDAQFHVCFASRHYPHITVRKGLHLILDNQEGHEDDIADYIQDKLNIGTGENAKKLRNELREKASGIFMWIVLVVKILNTKYDAGLSPTALRKELSKLPSDLHTLFREMMRRDTEMRAEMLLCIQWLLFSKRPLSPTELYLAIHAGAAIDNDNDDEIATVWSFDDATQDLVRRFILSASKGLAEITKTQNPTVQFIHESVTDFLLKEKGLTEFWPHLEVDRKGQSHERIKECCLRYIKIEHQRPSLQFSPAVKDTTKLLGKAITSTFPLMAYACSAIMFHAGEAESCGILQDRFFAELTIMCSRWARSYSNFHHTALRYCPSVSCLYLLTVREVEIDQHATSFLLLFLGVQEARYEVSLRSVIVAGSHVPIDVFLPAAEPRQTKREAHRAQEINTIPGPSVLTATFSGYERTLHALLLGGGEHVFAMASRHLGESNKVISTLDWRHLCNALLFDACKFPHDWAIPILLTQSIDLDGPRNCLMTPLGAATKHGRLSTMKILLQHRAYVDSRDKDGCTALMIASKHAQVAAVQLLLDHGADIETSDHGGLRSLHWACFTRDMIVVRLLLQHKARVDVKSAHGRTLLHTIVCKDLRGSLFIPVVRLLLEHIDTIDEKDDFGHTALHTAV